MKDITTTRLRFSYGGKRYSVSISSINYAGIIIINKLRIGHARVWLILQNDVWRFVSDMPLCRGLKNILIRKMTAFLNLPPARELSVAEQVPLRTGFLLNAVLNVLAVKKELP